ncbi:aldose 1-epimerase [uncultured Phenylobacterium sp.]|uniref:aldose 1-epimerase n=1 Tax=uncultured Phenylobacterium sp. TaxID=349273 RepID=UPI0025DFDC80|nr:aldose 1-epimerase [uncultured Phenylobacterium sp.]
MNDLTDVDGASAGHDWLVLRAGELEVWIAPHIGGSIARFDRVARGGRQHLMRAAEVDTPDAVEMASFPLVPFVNRVRDGRFMCDGRTIELAPNMAGDPSPLHGQGWRARWTVDAQDAAHVVLSFNHAAGEWPWDYTATQRIALDADGLTLTLTCHNRSALRMPCGLGLHPYHPCGPETVLDTEVDGVWTVDADVLPVERVPATGRYDLRARRICGQALDNGYDGWSGVALIHWPGQPASLRLTSDDAKYFQVYSPAAGGLFVAEPVQHTNAALNEPQSAWRDLGIVMLAPGSTRSITARYDVLVG